MYKNVFSQKLKVGRGDSKCVLHNIVDFKCHQMTHVEKLYIYFVKAAFCPVGTRTLPLGLNLQGHEADR
jgi:hypothetical protein